MLQEIRGGATPLGRNSKELDSIADKIYNSDMMNYKSRNGFTLAEVLITLAIVGIVAALTIPTLISNQKQRAWDTAANVFERKLEEALKTMNTQQTLAGYSDTTDFVSELSKHFKITEICQNDNLLKCFEDKVYWSTIDISLGKSVTEETDISSISTASDFGQENWNTNVVGVQFGNGATGILAYNPNCSQDPYSNQITGTSCIAMLYDTDGFKSPNTLGKDLRSINVQIGCTFKSGNVCYGTPFSPSIITAQECQELKDDLGIQQCCSTSICAENGDFWAGAAKVCGGTSNMPSHSQLLEIAKYVYNSSNIGVGVGPYYYRRDDNRAGLLGFKTHENTGFQIWINESSSEQARAFRFEPNYVHWHTPNKNSYGVQAVCIIN